MSLQSDFMAVAGKCSTLSGAHRVFVETVPSVTTLLIFTEKIIHISVMEYDRTVVKCKLPTKFATVELIMALAHLPLPTQHTVYKWENGWHPYRIFDNRLEALEFYLDAFDNSRRDVYRFEDDDNGFWVDESLNFHSRYVPYARCFRTVAEAKRYMRGE